MKFLRQVVTTLSVLKKNNAVLELKRSPYKWHAPRTYIDRVVPFGDDKEPSLSWFEKLSVLASCGFVDLSSQDESKELMERIKGAENTVVSQASPSNILRRCLFVTDRGRERDGGLSSSVRGRRSGDLGRRAYIREQNRERLRLPAKGQLCWLGQFLSLYKPMHPIELFVFFFFPFFIHCIEPKWHIIQNLGRKKIIHREGHPIYIK